MTPRLLGTVALIGAIIVFALAIVRGLSWDEPAGGGAIVVGFLLLGVGLWARSGRFRGDGRER